MVHRQADQAVVQKDGVAGLDVLRKLFIRDGADGLVAVQLAGGQREVLALFQLRAAVFKVAQADFGALGVQQGGHGALHLVAQGLQLIKAGLLLLVRAMGKVEPGHIHAGQDHLFHHVALVGRGAKGADDLCFAHIQNTPIQ